MYKPFIRSYMLLEVTNFFLKTILKNAILDVALTKVQLKNLLRFKYLFVQVRLNYSFLYSEMIVTEC